jgi:diguanylate cyclase (GGDEF)-like protein
VPFTIFNKLLSKRRQLLGAIVEIIDKLTDINTLLVINALFAALSAMIFLALQATRRGLQPIHGVLLWGISYAAFAVGFGIMTLPAIDMDFVNLPLVGNLLIDVGTVLALLAVNSYLKRPRRELWVLLPATLIGAMEIHYVLTWGENYRVMVIFGCALRGIVTIATGISLWFHANDAQRTGARLSAAFHFLWALMLLNRMAWWHFHPNTDISEDPTTAYGLISRLILTWVITPSLLWMLTRQLDAELIRFASQDPLTRIANRRVMWERGERLAAESNGQSRTMAVLIIDVDHFKVINDTWGHDVGDQVLVAIAEALTTHVREQDLLARVGGEEFMMLVSPGDELTAKDIAERLRLAVESRSITLQSGDRVTCAVSIGYSVATRGLATWREMVIAADQALYAAKHGGRNQVVGASSFKPSLEQAIALVS